MQHSTLLEEAATGSDHLIGPQRLPGPGSETPCPCTFDLAELLTSLARTIADASRSVHVGLGDVARKHGVDPASEFEIALLAQLMHQIRRLLRQF